MQRNLKFQFFRPANGHTLSCFARYSGLNMSNHALNRDDGAYLPEEYMHLIGRSAGDVIPWVFKKPRLQF